MAGLPESITQILADKEWSDPSRSGLSTTRFRDLYHKFKREGEINVNHLHALRHALPTRDLADNDCNRPWIPLFWFVQFNSWYYQHHIENPGDTQKRLFVGTIKVPSGQIPIWACGGPSSQFFSGPGPEAVAIEMDMYKRCLIDWYAALNELFDFSEMPYDDPTKPAETSTPAQKYLYLTNEDSGWDVRQDNYIKALIRILEAYPGLIMEKAPNQIRWIWDVQVYKGLPKFPFISDEVDSSQPDLATLLEQKDSQPEPTSTDPKSAAALLESSTTKHESLSASKSTSAEPKSIPIRSKLSSAPDNDSTKTQ